MSSNFRTIADEDGDFPDWIELYNSGTSEINLGAFALSDNESQPLRWVMPPALLGPNEHFLVFASGKNRRGGSGAWKTVIDYGNTFRYYHGSTPPDFRWRNVTFDDSGWSQGPSPLGYERDANGAEIATEVPFGTRVLYLRTTFVVESISEVVDAILHVDYDDAFIASLNGQPVAWGNVPHGSSLSHTSFAPSNHEAVIHTGGYPERFAIPDLGTRLRAGENVLSIQLHNVSSESSDLTVIPFLTLAYNRPLPGGNEISSYLPNDLDSHPHTNFSLDADREAVILTDTLGNTIDEVYFSGMRSDQSIGRKPDGVGDWFTFIDPTPGAPNLTDGFAGDPLIEPVFSASAGKYGGQISLTISSPEGAAVYYTTDGSPPSTRDIRYTVPIPITQPTVVRARAIAEGRLPSNIVTNTYLINESSSIPVVSLTTDPPNLWDYETGIYANGPGWTPDVPHFGANFWQEWEIPMHVEFFEPDGTRPIAQDAGGRIYGAWSRARPQKSFAIFARNRYGPNRFQHRIFAGRNYDSFVSLVLRNSGNDANQLHFIDAFMQELVHYTGLETLEYRPAHIYLNGEYWGILNLREKANEYHVAARHGLDPDSVDVLEMAGGTAVALEGTVDAYTELTTYLGQNDMTRPESYAYAADRIEIDNFIDYQVAQIYFANTDWPGNNHKFWRPQTPDGKFRWILFDTDFGFGSNNSHTHNTLAFATAPNGPGWPNPPGSTFLLRRLLLNRAFRDAFVNRFADHLNFTFTPDRIRATMDRMSAVVEPEINRHFSRWGGSMNNWRNKRSSVISFGVNRTTFMWTLLRSFFELQEPKDVRVNTSDIMHGRVRVNRHLSDHYPWTGKYFPGVLVRIEAIPRPGYRFVRWTGNTTSLNRVLTVDPGFGYDITAVFERDDAQVAPIRFSEIHYHPPADMPSGDWVELYNPLDENVDLSGWLFQDEDSTHTYYIPNGTSISAGGFLVLAERPAAFASVYPQVPGVIGGWDFALSNSGEAVRLFTPSGELVNEVVYSDTAPWPAEPDGGGPSLELAHLLEDNRIAALWESSEVRGGTPGSLNTTTVPVSSDSETELPDRIVIRHAYPNPFHESTTIPFSLPKAAHVTLRVFNALGQLVETLHDAPFAAGDHVANWIPAGAASGVYFYVLEVDGARQGAGKAVLVR